MIDRPEPSRTPRSPRSRTLRAGVLSVLLLLALVACGTTEPSGPPTEPDLTIASPTDGEIVDDPSLTVEGLATHPNGVFEVVATIGGREVACDQNGDSYACDVSPLAEGDNTIVVTATGGDGGTASAQIVVTFEPPDPGAVPPELTIDAPEDGAVVTESEVVVQGTVTHPIDVERVDATIDGETNDCSTAGTGFACTVALTVEGTNVITVTAVGVDGGTASRTVQIEFQPSGADPDAPTVDVDSPSDGAVINADEVRFQGTASHASGIESVIAQHGTETECDVVDSSFECDIALTSDGERSVTVRATATDGTVGERTIHVDRQRHFGDASRFTFQLVFFDHPYTQEHFDAFDEAVELWESVVIGDLEDVTANFSANTACGQGEPGFVGGIDDLLIFVSGFDDPASSVLGVAGPCRSRSSASNDFGTNAVGYMEFNASFLDDLASDGHLVETIVHEIGHVLGFGTNWEPLFSPHDLLDYETDPAGERCRLATAFTSPPRFTGEAAIAAYEARGFTGPVPVEDQGGAGTQCGHWDEDTFGAELMTGFLNRGVTNPLSDISIASLEDIGLSVDMSQAEEYVVPTTLDTLDHDHEHRFDIAAHEILLHPIGTIDPGTGTLLDFDLPGADQERTSPAHDHEHHP